MVYSSTSEVSLKTTVMSRLPQHASVVLLWGTAVGSGFFRLYAGVFSGWLGDQALVDVVVLYTCVNQGSLFVFFVCF